MTPKNHHEVLADKKRFEGAYGTLDRIRQYLEEVREERRRTKGVYKKFLEAVSPYLTPGQRGELSSSEPDEGISKAGNYIADFLKNLKKKQEQAAAEEKRRTERLEEELSKTRGERRSLKEEREELTGKAARLVKKKEELNEREENISEREWEEHTEYMRLTPLEKKGILASIAGGSFLVMFGESAYDLVMDAGRGFFESPAFQRAAPFVMGGTIAITGALYYFLRRDMLKRAEEEEKHEEVISDVVEPEVVEESLHEKKDEEKTELPPELSISEPSKEEEIFACPACETVVPEDATKCLNPACGAEFEE